MCLRCSNNVLRSALAPLGLSSAAIRALLDDPQRAHASVNATATANAGTAADNDAARRVRAALVPAYRRGFRIVFVVGAALAGLAVLLAWALLPQVDLHRPDDDAFREKKHERDGRAGQDEEAAAAAAAASVAVSERGTTDEEEKEKRGD